jgi:hypothetical protein
MDTPEFKNEFWKWFDALPKIEKQRFWDFAHDFACLYFYNKFYSKMPQ